MSKFMTMYGANKPSTLINDTRWGGIIFRENPVRSDMPNNNIPSRYCRSYGDFPKKISPRLVSLIKVEGLFAPYIISIFDIVNSGTSVQRYIQLVPSLVQI